jgi:hypothetical protein
MDGAILGESLTRPFSSASASRVNWDVIGGGDVLADFSRSLQFACP